MVRKRKKERERMSEEELEMWRGRVDVAYAKVAALVERGVRLVGKCPVCGGRFVGRERVSCENPTCPLYDEFAMSYCLKCGRRRTECSCVGGGEGDVRITEREKRIWRGEVRGR